MVELCLVVHFVRLQHLVETDLNHRSLVVSLYVDYKKQEKKEETRNERAGSYKYSDQLLHKFLLKIESVDCLEAG